MADELPVHLTMYLELITKYVTQQALIQDQISTSPSPRAVDAPRGRRTDIITYIINNITIKGNYEPTLLLQIINVYL